MFDMKRLIIFMIAALIAVPVFTQELSKKEQKKLNKELKKEQKALEAAQKAAIVDVMVNYQRFVLEANTLRNKSGQSVQVSPTINFIAADSLTGVIQVGSEMYIGRNGVGGITLDGSVSDYKYSKDEKNGSYYISYYLRTVVGTYDVKIRAYSDGRADADVSAATWGNKITYAGYLVPLAISTVYKGTSL